MDSNLLHRESDEARRQLAKQEGEGESEGRMGNIGRGRREGGEGLGCRDRRDIGRKERAGFYDPKRM